MFFNSRPKPQLEAIMFGNEVIDWVDEFKYLGLVLNSKMSFSNHIERVCNRVSQYIGVFYNLNRFLPRDILLLLYNAFILPHLSLHIVIWGAAPDVYTNKLKVKQNKLLRAILGVEVINGITQEPTMAMYNKLGVLTISNLFKLSLFKFLNHLLKGSLPYFYDVLLRPLLTTHNYGTRTGRFRHPLVVCEVERRAIAHQLVLMYDETRPNLNERRTTESILRQYKKFLLVQQNL